MVNKKVRNAATHVYDGITFRSMLEQRIYQVLKEEGFEPEYEVEKITLLESFKPKQVWYIDGKKQVMKSGKESLTVREKTYTPDFRFTLAGGTTVYLEAKGHPNDAYPVTRKMFLWWIDQQLKPILFVEIHSVKGLRDFINVLREEIM